MAAYLPVRLGRPLVSTIFEWTANQPVRLIRHSTIYRFSEQSHRRRTRTNSKRSEVKDETNEAEEYQSCFEVSIRT